MIRRPILCMLALSVPVWTLPADAQDYALDAPERVHIRQNMDVSWTSPHPTGGLLEIRADLATRSRASYAHTHNNPQSILAPEAPGDYVLVYVYEREVRASRPLTVFMPEATLETPANVDAGAHFEVVWTGPDSRQDRIVLAERDGPPIRGSSYAYVGNSRDGPARLRAPMDEGDYDVVYVSGSTILARSSISVGTISASLGHASRVHAGGTLRVVWEGPRNAQDQVTFATRDGDRVRGTSYAYVGNFEDNIVPLRAPEQTGPFDVVYVSGSRVIGRSPVDIIEARVDLQGPEEVTALEAFHAAWDGEGNRGDWIGIIDAQGERLAYGYIRVDERETRVVAPVAGGDYHLVYISRDRREMARRPIRVLPAAQPPGTLLVEQGGSALGPDDAVAVIFDASGSMLQRLDGVRRVEIARQTLSELVGDAIPAGTGFALRVFGHREAGSCRTDLEIPLGPLDLGAAVAAIGAVNAMNLARTPLGRSIEQTAVDLAKVTGKRLLIVLTDGEETCDGDPAAAIEGLRARGGDVTVNIVGFAIDDAALQAEFAAWAQLGGGEYFSATDRDSLRDALLQAALAPFAIANAAGETVIIGRAGESIVLPAGDYLIHWDASRTTPVTVSSQDIVRMPYGG